MNPQPEVPSDDETTDYGDDGGNVTQVPGSGWGDAGGDDLQNGKTAGGRQDPSTDSNNSGFTDPSQPPNTGEGPRPVPADDAGRYEETDAGIPEAGGAVAL